MRGRYSTDCLLRDLKMAEAEAYALFNNTHIKRSILYLLCCSWRRFIVSNGERNCVIVNHGDVCLPARRRRRRRRRQLEQWRVALQLHLHNRRPSGGGRGAQLAKQEKRKDFFQLCIQVK